MPAAAAAGSCSARGSRPIFAKADVGTSTSIAADTVAPSRMNGIASTSSEPNTTSRLRSHGRSGSGPRTARARAASTSIPITEAPDRRRPAVGVRGGGGAAVDVDGHQQYLANATEKDGYASQHERLLVDAEQAAEGVATWSELIPREVTTAGSRNTPSLATAETTGAPTAASSRRATEPPGTACVAVRAAAGGGHDHGGVRHRRRHGVDDRRRTAIHRLQRSAEHHAQHVGDGVGAVPVGEHPVHRGRADRPRAILTSSSSEPTYQPSPTRPRSATSGATSPIREACPFAWSRSSAERRDHGGRRARVVHARVTRSWPAQQRAGDPVL